MKKYYVYFTTKSGDYEKEWCYAESKEAAADSVMREHWDVASIDSVQEA